jgi:hypothetical protein
VSHLAGITAQYGVLTYQNLISTCPLISENRGPLDTFKLSVLAATMMAQVVEPLPSKCKTLGANPMLPNKQNFPPNFLSFFFSGN